MKPSIALRLLYCITILFFTRCQKLPKTPISEQELITTLKLTLTDTAAPLIQYTYVFSDIDGVGGLAPAIDSVYLLSGSVYHASLLLLDERNYPADTTTLEINELSTEHQFFYQGIPTGLLSDFNYLDTDSNLQPLGNNFSFRVSTSPGNGYLSIILRHLLDKNAPNVATGNITNAGGETDIEVEFPVRILP